MSKLLVLHALTLFEIVMQVLCLDSDLYAANQ
jgi:hypothetical protein